jgi:nicotinamidase-related amidase
MTARLALQISRSAMLSMDYQAGIVDVYTKNDPAMLERAAALLSDARACGMAVIHVRVGFRPKFPEVSPRNMLFSAIKNSPRHQQLFESDAGLIHPAVAPQGDDVTVTKHRVSAFAGTDLEMILRAKEIDTLVLFGIATSGVVLSTLLHASDADYRLIVIKDCCADADPEVHACLLDKVFPRRATVVSAHDFREDLKAIQAEAR